MNEEMVLYGSEGKVELRSASLFLFHHTMLPPELNMVLQKKSRVESVSPPVNVSPVVRVFPKIVKSDF